MDARARSASPVGAAVVVAACGATGGAHAGLVPAHLEHEPGLAIAFVLAAGIALVAAGALAVAPSARTALAAAGVLAALIAAYALSVSTGIPGLAPDPERADAIGLATKAVESAGLIGALRIVGPLSARGRLIHEEVAS